MPKPVKWLLRPIYHFYKKLTFKPVPITYTDQLNDEISRFTDETEVNDLPDIFHYWSNKYLVPKFKPHGFSNPDEFFYKYAMESTQNQNEMAHILSIGSGNCDSEVRLAKQLKSNGINNFVVTCLDINSTMLQRGHVLAQQHEVTELVDFEKGDFNHWKPKKKYDLVIANQCLHHVVELEHLYDSIYQSLAKNGKFITSDVIGRNGHMRWPEALNELKKVWKSMPDRYKYNHAMKRFEKKFINHDCSIEGFEGIRAQDVLPLLFNQFKFELFIPFANLILIFVDRSFGSNFDVENPEDIRFIDEIHSLDEYLINNGTIKPTQMMAVLTSKSDSNSNLSRADIEANQAVRVYQ